MYDIQQKDNFVLRFEQTVKECWNNPALNDYKGPVKTYGQLAEDIEKILGPKSKPAGSESDATDNTTTATTPSADA